MRRAFVISLLVHLFVVSLFQGRLDLPVRSPIVGDQHLSAVLRPSPPEAAIGRQVATERPHPGVERGAHVLGSEARAFGTNVLRIKSSSQDSRRSESRQSPVDEQSVANKAEADQALSPEVESEYRLHLARALRQEQVSRTVARAHGWDGRVGMTIAQRNGLVVPEVVLARSSGYAELDRLALSDVRAVLGKVVLPAGVVGQAFRLSFVLDYRPAE